MKIHALGAAAALMLAGAAPAYAQSAADWSGPYVGGFVGYGFGSDDGDETLLFDKDLDGAYDDQILTPTGTNAFSPGFCSGKANTALAADGCEDDDDGFSGGVRAGYDWAVSDAFVLGVVGEVDFTDVSDSVTGFSTTPANYVFTRDLEHIAAIRARAGFVTGPMLIYATGGYAMGKVENSFTTTNGANSFTATSDEDKADGYQLGAGVEYGWGGGWTLVGEYIYTSLDVDDYNIRVGPGTAPATNPFILAPNTTGTDMIRSSDSFDVHALRVGLNYRF
ncbi:MAG: porin family protein [Brevundimonas sp.]|nr:MAG: porin family protein [Brevundimonas sp.]